MDYFQHWEIFHIFGIITNTTMSYERNTRQIKRSGEARNERYLHSGASPDETDKVQRCFQAQGQRTIEY